MRKYRYQFFLFVFISIQFSCFKEDDYELTKASDVIGIEIDTVTQVEANGSAAALIKINLSNEAIPGRRKVMLKTDLGNFAGGNGDSILVMVDNNFYGEARLTSTRPGKASVKAIIAGLEQKVDGSVNFIRAYPDKITVSVDSFSISNSFKSEALITAALSSGNGVPSIRQKVKFVVLTSGGQPIGTFLNQVNTAETDASGKAHIRFSAGETSITGMLTVVAEAARADGTNISNLTYIHLTH